MRPDEDERVAAALAHASVVANIGGLTGLGLAGLIWATERERSRYVRGHALQALAFQGLSVLVGLLLSLAWGGCLLLSLLPLALRPELYADGTMPDAFWLALLGLFVPGSFAVAVLCYGLYGAYRAFRGQPFSYPLVGRLTRGDLAPPAEPGPPPAPAVPVVAAPPAIAEVVTPAPPESAAPDPGPNGRAPEPAEPVPEAAEPDAEPNGRTPEPAEAPAARDA